MSKQQHISLDEHSSTPQVQQTKMPRIQRVKMPRAQRAKQFVPFMPLESYPIALRERELKVEAEIELEHDSDL